MNMLCEQPKFEAASAHHLAPIRRDLLRDQVENRRLARAVAPNKADVLARIDLQRRAAQNVLRAE
jgi:hypothetical protein